MILWERKFSVGIICIGKWVSVDTGNLASQKLANGVKWLYFKNASIISSGNNCFPVLARNTVIDLLNLWRLNLFLNAKFYNDHFRLNMVVCLVTLPLNCSQIRKLLAQAAFLFILKFRFLYFTHEGRVHGCYWSFSTIDDAPSVGCRGTFQAGTASNVTRQSDSGKAGFSASGTRVDGRWVCLTFACLSSGSLFLGQGLDLLLRSSALRCL